MDKDLTITKLATELLDTVEKVTSEDNELRSPDYYLGFDVAQRVILDALRAKLTEMKINVEGGA